LSCISCAAAGRIDASPIATNAMQAAEAALVKTPISVTPFFGPYRPSSVLVMFFNIMSI
jgi:hypothetical protein